MSAPTATPVKATDASALAALLSGEPAADSVAERLGDARLVAPALLGFELADITSRPHPEQQSAFTAAFRPRDKLAVEEVAVDRDAALEPTAAGGLTAHDASYLWFTRQLGADLVTLDQQLARAHASSRP